MGADKALAGKVAIITGSERTSAPQDPRAAREPARGR